MTDVVFVVKLALTLCISACGTANQSLLTKDTQYSYFGGSLADCVTVAKQQAISMRLSALKRGYKNVKVTGVCTKKP